MLRLIILASLLLFAYSQDDCGSGDSGKLYKMLMSSSLLDGRWQVNCDKASEAKLVLEAAVTNGKANYTSYYGTSNEAEKNKALIEKVMKDLEESRKKFQVGDEEQPIVCATMKQDEVEEVRQRFVDELNGLYDAPPEDNVESEDGADDSGEGGEEEDSPLTYNDIFGSERQSSERLMNGIDAKTFASSTTTRNRFMTKLKIEEEKVLRPQRSAF